ncbi:MAG: type II secretion system GspH family protein [Clostridiaceae bacterium]|jgi:prepilin-type N-terminal cleavage/methylation domain-containing protein|nr:type II secretion system GspH family protein [Clostridiaceae bacterium]
MKKFKGFTLTELMVALAVIGVLTAIVTPTIMRIRPNRNKMMIKKAYYTAENIITSLINNTTYYNDLSDVQDKAYLGFDVLNGCTADGVDIPGNAHKFAELFASKLNTKGDCTDENSFHICTTTDGLIWYIPISTFGGTAGDGTKGGDGVNQATMFVDVNGDDAPNCRQNSKNYSGSSCTASDEDFDQFGIVIREDGKMQIDATGTGTGCTGDCKAAEDIQIDTKVSGD